MFRLHNQNNLNAIKICWNNNVSRYIKFEIFSTAKYICITKNKRTHSWNNLYTNILLIVRLVKFSTTSFEFVYVKSAQRERIKKYIGLLNTLKLFDCSQAILFIKQKFHPTIRIINHSFI